MGKQKLHSVFVLKLEKMNSCRMFIFVELLYVDSICILILHCEEVGDERERNAARFFWNSVRKT